MANSVLKLILLMFGLNEIKIGASLKLPLPEFDLPPVQADLIDAQKDLLPLVTVLLFLELDFNTSFCEILIDIDVLNAECIGDDVEWKGNRDMLLQALQDILPEQIYLLLSEIKKATVCDRLLHLCGEGDTVTPTEDTVAPTEDTVPPTEDTVPQTEDTVPQTEDTVAPTEDTVPPTEDTVPPTEDTVSPTEDTVPPTEDTVPPN